MSAKYVELEEYVDANIVVLLLEGDYFYIAVLLLLLTQSTSFNTA